MSLVSLRVATITVPLLKSTAALLAVLCALSVLPCNAAETLKITGTGSALGSMKLIGRAFEKAHPGVTVKVLPSTGSGGAIRGVSRGAVDIGLSSRPLVEEERKAGISALNYAKTPFVVAANRAVGVNGLRTEDLVRIYRGKLQTWPDGRKIRVVLRSPSDTDTEQLKRISPEMRSAVEVALSRPGALIALTDEDCADRIETTPGAVGFLALTQVTADKRGVRIIAFNGVTPSLKSLSKGSYPLAKNLYIVTRNRPPEKVRDFLRFVQSPKGRKLLEKSDSLPVKGVGK